MWYPEFCNVRRPACLTLIFTSVTCFLFLVTCNDDGPVRSQKTSPTVRLISKTACKNLEATLLGTAASVCTQDGIEFWTDSDSTLHVKHINAAFNCCMESLTVTVEIKGTVALITESDNMENGGCKCLCLYDAEYAISNLPSTVTKIEIAEPYAKLDQWPEEKPLCCTLVLPLTDTGSCCVERCHYPWARDLFPHIEVVGVSDCKTDSSFDRVYPSECVFWELTDNTLALRHVNAQLNCCLDSVTARIEMRGDTIMIVETEHTPPCDCLCPYDLDLRLTNILPGTYVFAIRYGPWDEGIPKLIWSADLTIAPTGTYCHNLCCGPD